MSPEIVVETEITTTSCIPIFVVVNSEREWEREWDIECNFVSLMYPILTVTEYVTSYYSRPRYIEFPQYCNWTATEVLNIPIWFSGG